MSELSMLIGKQVHSIRRKRGLTQEQVAEMTGIEGFNKTRVSKIESGKKNITLATLEIMMNALDVTPFEFFDFRKYQDSVDYEEKKLMIDAHKYMLMERQIEEIRYIVRTAKDFLETVDANKSKPHDKK